MHRIWVDVTAAYPFCARSAFTHSNTKACHSIKTSTPLGNCGGILERGLFCGLKIDRRRVSVNFER
jgi:hypothetical protein